MNDDVRAYVARSRAEQGKPPKVADPAVLRRVGRLVASVASNVVAFPAPCPGCPERSAA